VRAPLALVLLLLLTAPFGVEAQTAKKGSVMADYDPSLGVRITSPDGGVQLTAPTGALDKQATFAHETVDPPGAVGGSLRLRKAFRLEAEGTDKVKIKKFAKPLRLVVKYDDADLSELKVRPNALRLFYQDESSAWHVIPTTVDTAAKVLRAEVDHFTLFAAGAAGANDTFDRPDSTADLGTATSGQDWKTDGTIWGICGGTACAIGPTGGGNYVRIDSGYLSQDVAINVPARPVGSTQQAGILANVTPDWNSNLLYIGLDPTGKVEVWTLTSGTWSSGAVYAAQTDKTGITSHVLEAKTSGSSLTVLVDEVAVLGPVVVPNPPADATSAGLFTDTTEPVARWPHFTQFQAAPNA
jgi:hypothetical protein